MLIDKIALAFVIIGGINTGAAGIFGLDMLTYIFGGAHTTVARTVAIIIGISALWCISLLFRAPREQTQGSSHSAKY
jgi:Uncharacterized conserved protein